MRASERKRGRGTKRSGGEEWHEHFCCVVREGEEEDDGGEIEGGAMWRVMRRIRVVVESTWRHVRKFSKLGNLIL